MATKQKGQEQKPQEAKGGKKAGGDKGAARAPHKGADTPAPPPRLRVYYEGTVRPRLREQFGLGNPQQIPKLTKIVINVGAGEALKQPKLLDSFAEELELISGQRPVRTRAKKSISNFGLRQGQEIGASVTLRGARMWEFLDRFVNVAIPRIRDFRGINTRSFDGRGNYSVGLKEQVIFPEINYDRVEQIHGMDITFVTNAERDDRALALLRELGLPFRGDEKPVVVRA
ncbi:MAG: 50S ribosomal protein L5 [Gemmatimonadaceae bacterium]